MSAEENKTLVRRFFEEAWRKGNLAAVDEFMAADHVEHPLPSDLPPGPEGLKRLIAAYPSPPNGASSPLEQQRRPQLGSPDK